MKRFAKAFVVSGITLGAVLGLNVTEHNGVSNEAKAQTAHSYWYKYNGYTASGGDFVLSNSFYQGLKAGNVTFNGIKVNQKYESKTATKKIYDQTFQQINGNKANNVQFKIASRTVTLDQVKQKYGKIIIISRHYLKTKQVRQMACTVIKSEKETSFSTLKMGMSQVLHCHK